jgi:exosome complex RNA-binding protein Csl4
MSDIYELMEEALYDGVISAECEECGGLISVEPDATTAFCYSCRKVVKINNPLVEYGYI